jgi:nicotinate phosphoribosyltransferase
LNKFIDDSFALHTDLYQINMAEAYWEDNIHTKKAIFELYFRRLPFGNGYAIFAGLERIIEYLQSLHFSDSDVDYLKELGYQEVYRLFANCTFYRNRSCYERRGSCIWQRTHSSY